MPDRLSCPVALSEAAYCVKRALGDSPYRTELLRHVHAAAVDAGLPPEDAATEAARLAIPQHPESDAIA
jgi:hypothetical protein